MKSLRLPKLLLLLLLLISSVLTYAQEKEISGKIVDRDNNTPLEGVSVRVKTRMLRQQLMHRASTG